MNHPQPLFGTQILLGSMQTSYYFHIFDVYSCLCGITTSGINYFVTYSSNLEENERVLVIFLGYPIGLVEMRFELYRILMCFKSVKQP
jgi:hypothetical protein